VGIYIWLVAANVTVMLTGLHSNPGFAITSTHTPHSHTLG